MQFSLSEPAGRDFLDMYIKMQHKLVVKGMGFGDSSDSNSTNF